MEAKIIYPWTARKELEEQERIGLEVDMKSRGFKPIPNTDPPDIRTVDRIDRLVERFDNREWVMLFYRSVAEGMDLLNYALLTFMYSTKLRSEIYTMDRLLDAMRHSRREGWDEDKWMDLTVQTKRLLRETYLLGVPNPILSAPSGPYQQALFIDLLHDRAVKRLPTIFIERYRKSMNEQIWQALLDTVEVKISRGIAGYLDECELVILA